MSLTELIKELRERTGAGMLDCKKALTENNSDIEKAIDWLREKGISKAAKKSGRIAAEGLVFTKVTADNTKAVILEFNSETDFVAKNEDFVLFGKKLVDIALESNAQTVEQLKEIEMEGKKIADQLVELIAKIGENLEIRRLELLNCNCGNTVVVDYLHLGGKIGVLVKAKGQNSEESVDKLKGVAMHIAAMDPKFLNRDLVTEKDLEREKEVLTNSFIEEAKAKGKSVNNEMMEKIISGKIRKYYEENCLTEQKYVRDDKKTVAEFVKPLELVSFVRYKVGDGIEKVETDFAAEVAAQIAGK